MTNSGVLCRTQVDVGDRRTDGRTPLSFKFLPIVWGIGLVTVTMAIVRHRHALCVQWTVTTATVATMVVR